MATRYVIAFVTAPNLQMARKLASTALKQRLAACANILPKIESHYWWQGKLESGREVLVIFKTTSPKVKALERAIIASHPYDTPEFVVATLSQGSARYLKWIANSVKAAPDTANRPE